MNSNRTRWLIGILMVLALGASGMWFLPGRGDTQLSRLDVTISGHRPLETAAGVTEFGSQAELQRSYPEATFHFDRDIDFTREKLVHAIWFGDGFVSPGGSGPTAVVYSQLTPQSRLAGQRVFLAVEEPWYTGRVFGRVFQEDWYTLPKSTEVSIVGPGQAALWDGVHWLFAALAVLFPLAAVFEWKFRRRATA